METPELHRRAVDSFGAHVHAVAPDQWHLPTPCTEWDVRTLVNHLVYENRWTPPLFAGRTIAEIGDQFEGDLLGDDPVRAWEGAAHAATGAVQAPGAMQRVVHLSSGDTDGEEYAMQLFADHVIHGWDLARAIGVGDTIATDLLEPVAAWYEEREAMYREAGAVGERIDVPEAADAQTRLLAAFGRRR